MSVDIASKLNEVRASIEQISTELKLEKKPLLIAVSKTKPESDILECYEAGQKDFGENYVQELIEKAEKLPKDIRWHFIGTLQSNKAKVLCATKNLHSIHSISSVKVCNAVANAWRKNGEERQLDVFIQVNTSKEASKGGVVTEEELMELGEQILKHNDVLHLKGLMTIGSPDEQNKDFKTLVESRKVVCNVLGLSAHDLDLSMGMSADYIDAVRFGK